MTDEDIRATLLKIRAQITALEALERDLKDKVKQEALEEYERTGVATTWRMKGLGSVSLCTSEPRPVVTDERMFSDFVEEQVDPDAIETIRRVRDDAREHLFGIWEQAARSGVLVTEDGEVIPGVQLSQRPPYLSLRLDKAAKQAALEP